MAGYAVPKVDIHHYQAAGGVVMDSAGRVLLIERTLDDTHEVRLPKGHIDQDEAPELAARREVCEETGYCDVSILADLGRRQVTFEYRGRTVVREEHYYLMCLASDRQLAPRFSNSREALFRNRWAANFAEAAAALTFQAEQDVIWCAAAAHESPKGGQVS